MARVAWSDEARGDVAGIVRWIRRDSPDASARVGRRITTSTRILRLIPKSGSPVEDSSFGGLRELTVDSYSVVYVYRDSTCFVLRVFHAKQDLSRWVMPGDES